MESQNLLITVVVAILVLGVIGYVAAKKGLLRTMTIKFGEFLNLGLTADSETSGNTDPNIKIRNVKVKGTDHETDVMVQRGPGDTTVENIHVKGQGHEISIKVTNGPRRDDPPKPKEKHFKISLAFPRRLSKGYSSNIMVQIYPPKQRYSARKRIEEEFRDVEHEEKTRKAASSLKEGEDVEIAIESPVVDFSKPVVKTISQSGATTLFSAKPKDTCKPGLHGAILRIRDPSSQEEYQFVSFKIRIVDYAFDHISRPLLGTIASSAVVVGSLVSFLLGLLGQIDTTFGLTSGTVGATVAAFIYTRVNLYRQRGATFSHPD